MVKIAEKNVVSDAVPTQRSVDRAVPPPQGSDTVLASLGVMYTY
jgi:hypothetical protein